MNLDLLDTRKKKLTTATNFGEVMTYFFDHFGENAEFLVRGRREDSEDFERMAELVGSPVLEEKARPDRFTAVRTKEKAVLHGGGFRGGHIMNGFCFEDAFEGLLAGSIGGQTRVLRFTGQELPKDDPLTN